MDIAEHLTKHEKILRSLAFQYGLWDEDLVEDCYQTGVLVLLEAHLGSFRHESELLTYAYDGVKEAMLNQVKLVKTEYRYGITDELDELQEIAEEQGRERLHLDRLYDESIDGIRPITESSLSPEDEILAYKVWIALSEEEQRILEASYGRNAEQAARFLDVPRSTYRGQLQKTIKKAKELARLWILWRD